MLRFSAFLHKIRIGIRNMSAANTIILNNGMQMPIVGLGTSQGKLADVEKAVECGIDIGYRLIDCARIYGNESAVGNALRHKMEDGTVTRDQVFVVSKLWPIFQAPDRVMEGLDQSLKNLQLEYLDLFLIHWPMAFRYDGPNELRPKTIEGRIAYDETTDYVDTWKVFEKLLTTGKVRAIGISNFNLSQLKRLLKEAVVIPAVHQFECHPYLDQEEMLTFCKSKGIAVTGYSPFASPGRKWISSEDPNIFAEPALIQIAEKHRKTVAQIVLRYLIQIETAVIPKSVSPERIKSNFQVFDFKLTDEECSEIRKLDKHRRIMPPKASNFHAHKHFPFPVEELI